MSEAQLKAFMKAVKEDADLQENLKAAGEDADAVVAIAKKAGYAITADEFQWFREQVSEEELAGVAGGRLPVKFRPGADLQGGGRV